MRCNIYETVEVSDAQRIMLGAVLDGVVKPKRQATRDELKAYVWEHGSEWADHLRDDYRHDFEEDEGTDEDLI